MNTPLGTHDVTLQNSMVLQINRESALLLSIELLAEKILSLTEDQPEQDMLYEIQKHALAIQYSVELSIARLTELELKVNDTDFSKIGSDCNNCLVAKSSASTAA